MSVKKLVELLCDKKLKIATAESCTGGLLAKCITDIGGSSNVFEMGIVSYSNRIKNEFLNVSLDILDSVGAVSPETAEQMAAGVSRLAKSDIGVGITGFAGPTGDEVGLVYVSIYLNSIKKSFVSKLCLNGSREQIREMAKDFAVNEVLRILSLYF